MAWDFTQEKEKDYDETFAPITKLRAIRMLLVSKFHIYQNHVDNTFLNGYIMEKVCLTTYEF